MKVVNMCVNLNIDSAKQKYIDKELKYITTAQESEMINSSGITKLFVLCW